MGPSKVSSSSSSSSSTVTDDESNAAIFYIASTCDEERVKTIMTCTTALQMWQTFEADYEQKTSINKHVILQEWYDMKLDPDLSILANITRVQLLANKLLQLGETLSEAQQVTKIICSLPPSYQSIVSAWDNVPENQQTLANLKARLLKHESLMKKHGGLLANLDEAFFSSSKLKLSSQTRPSVSQPLKTKPHGSNSTTSASLINTTQHSSPKFCRYCKKSGHLIQECRKRNLIMAKATNISNLLQLLV